MEEAKDLFDIYKNDIKYIIKFIKDNFGTHNVLLRKNSGEIPNRSFDVKGSRIKGYVFHGYGCDFRFKNYLVDIEFSENEEVGFTSWSFYLFTKNKIPNITEEAITEFLQAQKESGVLKFNGKMFIVV